MQMQVILGLIRHILTTVGGAGITNGLLSDSDLQAAVGAIITLVGIAWSIYEKRTKIV